jgi:hypothetical protein
MSIPVAVTHPPQRSFKPRRRGLSPSRLAAYQRSIDRWGIAVEGPPLSFDGVFGTNALDVPVDQGLTKPIAT